LLGARALSCAVRAWIGDRRFSPPALCNDGLRDGRLMGENEWIEPHEKIGTFGGVYNLGRKLGCGSFGHVYLVVNKETGQEYAAKVESTGTKNQMIPFEAKLLRRLQGVTGFPTLHYYNVEGNYNIMVMDLLGPSLKDLFYMCFQRFSVKTVLMIIDQMLFRIQYLHSKGFIHRDIKPENFLVQCGRKANVVYIIDFGLAKRYRSAKTQQHIPYSDKKSLTGTARYASINAHSGIEQSRRDDMEAIGYVLIYFLQGQLPWQQLQADTKEEKYRLIMEAKKATPIEELCKGQPEVFAAYMRYCQGLQFEERPDYAHLRRMFKEAFQQEGFANDGIVDWMKPSLSERAKTQASEEHQDAQGGGPPVGRQGTGRAENGVEQRLSVAHAHSRGRAGSRASSRAPSEAGCQLSLQQRMISLFSQSTLAFADRQQSKNSHSVASSDMPTVRGAAMASPRSPTRAAPKRSGGSGLLASFFRCGSKAR